MEQCVDRLEEFIDEAGLDCGKIRPGFLRVATGDGDGAAARQCPFVNRRVISWPPEPAATAARYAIRGYLQAEDAFHEHLPARARRMPANQPPVPGWVRS
jgi:hypothetical protein